MTCEKKICKFKFFFIFVNYFDSRDWYKACDIFVNSSGRLSSYSGDTYFDHFKS